MRVSRRYAQRMALIACPECGEQVSDAAASCPKCGHPIRVDSVVVVAAPNQAMLMSPKVHVHWAGREVAVLKHGERATIPVDADGVLFVAAGLRSTQMSVRAGRTTRVQLGWDRISGKLVAQEVDVLAGQSLL